MIQRRVNELRLQDGDKLVLEDGAEVVGLPVSAGGAPVAECVHASTASTVAALKADVNQLIRALKACGLMAEE